MWSRAETYKKQYIYVFPRGQWVRRSTATDDAVIARESWSYLG